MAAVVQGERKGVLDMAASDRGWGDPGVTFRFGRIQISVVGATTSLGSPCRSPVRGADGRRGKLARLVDVPRSLAWSARAPPPGRSAHGPSLVCADALPRPTRYVYTGHRTQHSLLPAPPRPSIALFDLPITTAWSQASEAWILFARLRFRPLGLSCSLTNRLAPPVRLHNNLNGDPVARGITSSSSSLVRCM
ncbi:hypothetical protein VTN02DRAFT_5545 [Thermoascus thermophilus]